MGTGLAVRCTKCGASKMYSLGVGMMYFPLENVLDRLVPKKQGEKIRQLLKAVGEDCADYSHMLFACPTCETLNERFYIKVAKGDRILFATQFRCGKCRRTLTPVYDEDVSEYRCSDCGEKALEAANVLDWD